MTEDILTTNERQDELTPSESLTPAEDGAPIAGDSLIFPFIFGTGDPAEPEKE